jgi:glycosyltransferase involved in cell wall biosynthesis
LVRLGHRVDLLTFPQGTSVSVEGLRHFRSSRLPVRTVRPGPSPAKILLDVPFFAEAAARLLWGAYDAVHAVEEAVFVAPVACARGVPVIADVDSWIPEQLEESRFLPRGPLLGLATTAYKAALRASSLVVTPCASLTERVRQEIQGADVVQLEDLPLQEDREAEGSVDGPRLRRALCGGETPTTPTPRLVAYCGNFEPNQGVALVAAAAERCPGVRFIFVGGEAEQISALEADVKRRGVADRCLILGRQTPQASLRVIECADILVVPRTRGSHTGFKIATCMAAGKPLVATRIPAHTQVLDESLAALVEPTAVGIAEGIQSILADPVGAEARARRAKAYAEDRLGSELFRTKLAEALARLGRSREIVPASEGPPAGEAEAVGQPPAARGKLSSA